MIKLSDLRVTTSSIVKFISSDTTAFDFTQNNNAAFNTSGAEASNGMYFPSNTNDLRVKLGNGSFIENFNNFDNFSTSNFSNAFIDNNKLRISYNLYTGTGNDGNVTITGTKNINTDSISSIRVRPDAVNFNVISLSSTTARLSVTPNSDDLTIGDEILLINLQGTSSDYSNVGNYETLKIKSISTDIITFTTPKSKYYGTGVSDDLNIGTTVSNQRVMIQRIPQYNNVTVDIGNTLTANAWDGTKGGVLFFRVAGTLTLYGTITMQGKGYRGGSGGAQGSGVGGRGTQGESYNKLGVVSSSANASGGAGGVPSTQNGSSGDQNGGPGYGAASWGSTDGAKMYLGSGGGGGGGGDWTYGTGTGKTGSTGGGIVAVHANEVNMQGTVNSNGNPYTAKTGYGGAGGAGGGGATVFKVINLTMGTSTISSSGGTGTSPSNAGDGKIAVHYNDVDGTIITTPTAYSLQTTTINNSANLKSTKILDGHTVNSVKNLNYRLETKPFDTEIKIQFSQDQSNQYDSGGNQNQWSNLTTDVTVLSLSGLSDQTGNNFYYRIDMSSDGNDSPVLDQIEIDYDPDAYTPSEQYQLSHIIDSNVGARIESIYADQVLDQSDKINPKFQLMGSNTGTFTGEEIIFPAGEGSFYQYGGTYSINNRTSLNVQQQTGFNFYRYQRVKAILDAGNDLTDCPILRSFSFNGIRQAEQSSMSITQSVADSTTVVKNTSVKILEKSVSVTETARFLVIAELELDNTGYDFTNGGTLTNMWISRDGTQLHEKLEANHVFKFQYQKTVIDIPPVGNVKYQVYASETLNKCDSKVIKCNLRVYSI